jgi:hypothetical protein
MNTLTERVAVADTVEKVLNVVGDLSSTTRQESKSLHGGDIAHGSHSLHVLVPRMQQLMQVIDVPHERQLRAEKFTTDVVSTADSLIASSTAWTDLPEKEQSIRASELLDAINTAAVTLAESLVDGTHKSVDRPNICKCRITHVFATACVYSNRSERNRQRRGEQSTRLCSLSAARKCGDGGRG